jgi:PTH2 family peptidyl-tRNA hydrolase
MPEYKQVIILRKDLNMRKGKMVAQGAHASVAAITQHAFKADGKDESVDFLCIPLTPDIKYWLNDHFTKITAGVDSEEELVKLYEQAKEAGIRCSMIVDSGHTEFKLIPTKTAVAIGPDEVSKIDKITGHLKLI